MPKQIKNGSTGNILRFLAVNSNGALFSGLTSATAGLVLSTIMDAESAPVSYAVSASNLQSIASIGTYSAPAANKAGFQAVHSGLHPALYEVHLADARFSNSAATQLVLQLTGASAEGAYEIALVGYDPSDVPSTDSAVAAAVASNSAFVDLFSNVDAILDDTGTTGVLLSSAAVASNWATPMSDLASVPVASAAAKDALNWMFEVSRNKVDQTSALQRVYKDDGTTILASAVVSATSGASATFTRGEFA